MFLRNVLTLNVQGLNEVNPDAVSLEERNALALAIIPSGRLQHQYSDCFLTLNSIKCFVSSTMVLGYRFGPGQAWLVHLLGLKFS